MISDLWRNAFSGLTGGSLSSIPFKVIETLHTLGTADVPLHLLPKCQREMASKEEALKEELVVVRMLLECDMVNEAHCEVRLGFLG